jgi:sec-independent protein translocase protein TatA
MFANLTGWHALLILAVVLLLFGAPKIPALARSLGQSLRIFKTEIKETDTASDVTPAASTAAPAPEARS